MKRLVCGTLLLLAAQVSSADIVTVVCTGCNPWNASDPQVTSIVASYSGLPYASKVGIVSNAPMDGVYHRFAIWEKLSSFYDWRHGSSTSATIPQWAFWGGGGGGQ